MSDDPIATILKLHLVSEYYLERVIGLTVHHPEKIIGNRGFGYSQKLSVVDALGEIDVELVEALKNLNKLRNRCSHKLNYEVTLEDLDKIGMAFGETWEEYKRKSLTLEKQLADIGGILCAELGKNTSLLREAVEDLYCDE